MTPEEYKKRFLAAMKTRSNEEYADIARQTIREYTSLAEDKLKGLCDENVTEHTLWIWVCALRKTADKLESESGGRSKAILDFIQFIQSVFETNGAVDCDREADGNVKK